MSPINTLQVISEKTICSQSLALVQEQPRDRTHE